ncbi:hypothetical protein ONE63_008057 [Megalurothrips usitatus]|uniref:Lipase domain-containing protein n=1 Tax=Megalurothrips usitatus TaxID=439358 RepID=A0AAV7XW15_9NEOP|nr:hypothetical protein ONE63_008057 [Megalurothrips usitatus]
MWRLRACLLLTLAVLTHEVSGESANTSPIPGAEFLKEVKLRMCGRSLDDYGEYLLKTKADGLLTDTRFIENRPTVIYVHGYVEDATKESVRTVLSAFMAHGGYNAVFLDWSRAAAESYASVMELAPRVGRMLAHQLDAWHEAGTLNISNVYLVGHSMGGQVVGFAGKFTSKCKVPRITALDPALPGFSERSLTAGHLTPTDARFVDVIHTDGGVYGVDYVAGHVDFFPNGGHRMQPGCLHPSKATLLSDEDLCSHRRSWRYFAESLNASLPAYYGVACPSHEDFVAGRCDGNKRVVMGFPTPTRYVPAAGVQS